MLRRLIFGLLMSLSLVFVDSPTVRAQQPSAPDTEKSDKSTPVFPYFLLIIYSLLILTVVCMPSRKA